MLTDPTATIRDVVLRIDETIYHRTTVLRACYWFTDRCHMFVTRPTPGILEIHIRPKLGQDPERLSNVAGELTNALLDYELRRLIDQETGKIRELLVAKAVAAAGSLDDQPPGSPNDPIDERFGPGKAS